MVSIEVKNGLHIRGLICLPNKKWTACGTCVVMEENGSDWLDLYIPTGSLSQHYEIDDSPFIESDKNLIWRKSIDNLLATIGMDLYSEVKYEVGLIGFEVSGNYYSEKIKSDGIPKKREIGFLFSSISEIKYFSKNI